jgi:hypothetical protein
MDQKNWNVIEQINVIPLLTCSLLFYVVPFYILSFYSFKNIKKDQELII